VLHKLFVTVLCLWKAVAIESGVTEFPGAADGPAKSYWVSDLPAPDPVALEHPAIRIAEWLQPSESNLHMYPGSLRTSNPFLAHASLRKGWQSEAAVHMHGSREQLRLFPFHTFL
jgi:hypothetical protein